MATTEPIEYLLLEDDGKTLLENSTGAVLLEQVAMKDLNWTERPSVTGSWTEREGL